MSLKLITLAALGTAAQAATPAPSAQAATTYSKAKCITGYASNLQKDQGIPLVVIDSTAGYCMAGNGGGADTTKSMLLKCDGTFLFYFPKCCLIIIFHLNFSFPVGFFFLSQVKKWSTKYPPVLVAQASPQPPKLTLTGPGHVKEPVWYKELIYPCTPTKSAALLMLKQYKQSP